MNQIHHQLSPCPDKPNCVSSLSTNQKQYIEPLVFSKNHEQAMPQLCSLLESLPGVNILHQDHTYIHAVCRSRIFRFKDDIEFLYDESSHVCHVRSVSRMGHSDFGVNRRRVEKVRKLFVK